MATTVYLITMDRSVSWWDCGEFIAIGWTLGVGHPPGAPFYQLVTHLAMLLSFGHTAWIAPLSNAVSALCAGITVGLLFASLRLMGASAWASWVGSLCYLFCDTAWFSAVESEVYAMSMLFCSLQFYLALLYRHKGNTRLPVLMGLAAGLGLCVHMMTLLVLPATVLVCLAGKRIDISHPLPAIRLIVAVLFFFALGLTPYAIVPLRAASNPAINEMGENFESYLKREQYEKAPLYPRMWRERDYANWSQWNAGLDGLAGNIVYTATYQVGYMYGRYLMYNFIGRENLKSHRIVLFVLPLLLGLWGVWNHFRRRRIEAWGVMLMFLFGGLLLNLYLNHPCYEPRERDYAYILSFYAFAMWIGIGADMLKWGRWRWIFILAPFSLALGNWSDHDRHRCHSVHDIALNHLESCEKGSVLITLGDNDTFPLWYLQEVEGLRTDVQVMNVGLAGWYSVAQLLEEDQYTRPIYVSHYFYQRYEHLFDGRWRCEGYCWRLMPARGDDLTPRMHKGIGWHMETDEYIDPISSHFLDIWRENTTPFCH